MRFGLEASIAWGAKSHHPRHGEERAVEMNVEPLSRFEWERVVMAVDIAPTTKLVALGLATFANRSGGNAHPGNARLARELNVTVRTVERHLETLRSVGLVERTFRGSAAGRRRMADVYRLVVADDLHDRVSFIESPDSSVVCTTSEQPTFLSGDSGLGSPEHPTPGTEHPTAETGTPDTGDGSPVTGVAPTCMYITEEHQEGSSSFGSTRAAVSELSTDEAVADELSAIKRLPAAALQQLLAEAQGAVGDQGWSAVVHYAATHMPEGAVA